MVKLNITLILLGIFIFFLFVGSLILISNHNTSNRDYILISLGHSQDVKTNRPLLGDPGNIPFPEPKTCTTLGRAGQVNPTVMSMPSTYDLWNVYGNGTSFPVNVSSLVIEQMIKVNYWLDEALGDSRWCDLTKTDDRNSPYNFTSPPKNELYLTDQVGGKPVQDYQGNDLVPLLVGEANKEIKGGCDLQNSIGHSPTWWCFGQARTSCHKTRVNLGELQVFEGLGNMYISNLILLPNEDGSDRDTYLIRLKFKQKDAIKATIRGGQDKNPINFEIKCTTPAWDLKWNPQKNVPDEITSTSNFDGDSFIDMTLTGYKCSVAQDGNAHPECGFNLEIVDSNSPYIASEFNDDGKTYNPNFYNNVVLKSDKWIIGIDGNEYTCKESDGGYFVGKQIKCNYDNKFGQDVVNQDKSVREKIRDEASKEILGTMTTIMKTVIGNALASIPSLKRNVPGDNPDPNPPLLLSSTSPSNQTYSGFVTVFNTFTACEIILTSSTIITKILSLGEASQCSGNYTFDPVTNIISVTNCTTLLNVSNLTLTYLPSVNNVQISFNIGMAKPTFVLYHEVSNSYLFKGTYTLTDPQTSLVANSIIVSDKYVTLLSSDGTVSSQLYSNFEDQMITTDDKFFAKQNLASSPSTPNLIYRSLVPNNITSTYNYSSSNTTIFKNEIYVNFLFVVGVHIIMFVEKNNTLTFQLSDKVYESIEFTCVENTLTLIDPNPTGPDPLPFTRLIYYRESDMFRIPTGYSEPLFANITLLSPTIDSGGYNGSYLSNDQTKQLIIGAPFALLFDRVLKQTTFRKDYYTFKWTVNDKPVIIFVFDDKSVNKTMTYDNGTITFSDDPTTVYTYSTNLTCLKPL